MNMPSGGSAKAAVGVEVQFACAAPRPGRAEVRRWARAALAAAGPTDADLTVRLVDEDEIAALNLSHRGKAGPTNVLSFPGPDPAMLAPDVARPLGDVVVCAPLARAEAARFGKTDTERLAHLVVHGVLHLLGHDHHAVAARRRMEALERGALAALDLPDPYRVGTGAR